MEILLTIEWTWDSALIPRGADQRRKRAYWSLEKARVNPSVKLKNTMLSTNIGSCLDVFRRKLLLSFGLTLISCGFDFMGQVFIS